MHVKCPRCNTFVEWEGNNFRPFCSERCKLIDLGAWIKEDYKIEMERTTEEGQKDSTPSHSDK